jgi:hypothetical protein
MLPPVKIRGKMRREFGGKNQRKEMIFMNDFVLPSFSSSKLICLYFHQQNKQGFCK